MEAEASRVVTLVAMEAAKVVAERVVARMGQCSACHSRCSRCRSCIKRTHDLGRHRRSAPLEKARGSCHRTGNLEAGAAAAAVVVTRVAAMAPRIARRSPCNHYQGGRQM